jgi:ADP-heptose:LPS heptosyltransferase
LKDYGQIPGGSEKLKVLLYPYEHNFPGIIFSKYRWWKNRRLDKVLPKLNQKQNWLTVIDRLGAPGDALITANVIRCIKDQYPKLKINCITPHPELIKYDRSIDSINKRETFYSFDSSYWELIVRKEAKENVIQHNMSRLGIKDYEYKGRFFLNTDEKEWGQAQIASLDKPILAICTRSKEPVKNWALDNWSRLVESAFNDFSIIQLGDASEPKFDGVISFAGKSTMRESAAILSHSDLFICPDSLMMHVANGLKIKTIALFGGSRTVSCLGYEENINVETSPVCSPCWIHEGYGECSHDLACMREITTKSVAELIELSLKNVSV